MAPAVLQDPSDNIWSLSSSPDNPVLGHTPDLKHLRFVLKSICKGIQTLGCFLLFSWFFAAFCQADLKPAGCFLNLCRVEPSDFRCNIGAAVHPHTDQVYTALAHVRARARACSRYN